MARPICSTLSMTIRTARNAAEVAEAAQLYVRSGRHAFTWRAPGHFKAEDFIRFAEEEEVWLALMGGDAPERSREAARQSNNEAANLPLLGILSVFRPGRFIHCLYVDPDAQGLGVGRALVERVRKDVGGPLTLKLDVPNRKAIAFYESTGWERLIGLDDQGVDDTGITWARYRLP
ncbi:MAG: GNAT family N-acetyltransferase [Alphaproteobacteria bacterium]|nr:GNAT family N-acetyltransferase [Alphaproteobacteria bacterium]MBV9902983.1 GNAT family N-acetyltransferase [Alphaproteobacteria bacterium]